MFFYSVNIWDSAKAGKTVGLRGKASEKERSKPICVNESLKRRAFYADAVQIASLFYWAKKTSRAPEISTTVKKYNGR